MAFEELNELVKYPPLSQERLDVLRKSIPRQRALLRPEQYAAFDGMMQEAERRFELLRKKRQQQISGERPGN
jgi:hypothetical protein